MSVLAVSKDPYFNSKTEPNKDKKNTATGEVAHKVLEKAKESGHEVSVQNRTVHPLNGNAKENSGDELLDLFLNAAREGNTETLGKLISQRKSLLDAADSQGFTPLMLSSKHGREEACKFLLDSGASIEARNKFGLTALHIVAYCNQPGTCEILLRAGADIKAKNQKHTTPFNFANDNGNTEIVELLQQAERIQSKVELLAPKQKESQIAKLWDEYAQKCAKSKSESVASNKSKSNTPSDPKTAANTKDSNNLVPTTLGRKVDPAISRLKEALFNAALDYEKDVARTKVTSIEIIKKESKYFETSAPLDVAAIRANSNTWFEYLKVYERGLNQIETASGGKKYKPRAEELRRILLDNIMPGVQAVLSTVYKNVPSVQRALQEEELAKPKVQTHSLSKPTALLTDVPGVGLPDLPSLLNGNIVEGIPPKPVNNNATSTTLATKKDDAKSDKLAIPTTKVDKFNPLDSGSITKSETMLKKVDEIGREVLAPQTSPNSNQGVPLDHQTIEKLKVLATIDLSSLQALQGRSSQLLRLFEEDAKVEHSDQEKALIDADANLQVYYQFFARLLSGTWMACQTISSGMVDNTEMYKSDYVGRGLDQIGQCVPGASLFTCFFSGVIKGWNDRDKKLAVQRMAEILFPDLETAFKELSRFSRQVTLSQEKQIKSMPIPNTLAGKIKEKIKDIVTFVLAEDANSPLKRKAEEDCKKLLTAIKDGKVPQKPTLEDLLCVIMGPGFKYQSPVSGTPSPSQKITTSPSNNSTASSDSAVNMMDLAEELRKMKEREIKREAELERMKKKVDKLEEQRPLDDSNEIGDKEVQLKLLKSKQTTSVASATGSAITPQALHHQTEEIRTDVTIVTAKISEHDDHFIRINAEISKLQKQGKNKDQCIVS